MCSTRCGTSLVICGRSPDIVAFLCPGIEAAQARVAVSEIPGVVMVWHRGPH
jgi:hypothetical protein